jgi:hypothetical protein
MLSSAWSMRITVEPLELGDERQFLAYGFLAEGGGTVSFNFWQSAAKRGSLL